MVTSPILLGHLHYCTFRMYTVTNLDLSASIQHKHTGLSQLKVRCKIALVYLDKVQRHTTDTHRHFHYTCDRRLTRRSRHDIFSEFPLHSWLNLAPARSSSSSSSSSSLSTGDWTFEPTRPFRPLSVNCTTKCTGQFEPNRYLPHHKLWTHSEFNYDSFLLDYQHRLTVKHVFSDGLIVCCRVAHSGHTFPIQTATQQL